MWGLSMLRSHDHDGPPGQLPGVASESGGERKPFFQGRLWITAKECEKSSLMDDC